MRNSIAKMINAHAREVARRIEKPEHAKRIARSIRRDYNKIPRKLRNKVKLP